MFKFDFSVIIITYNSAEFILQCLESLSEYKTAHPIELIVIDNASEDNTVALVKLHYPDIQLIANKKNLGYSTACNIGFKHSGGQTLCFCNPDIIFLNNVFESMRLCFQDEKIGCAGPKIFNSEGLEVRYVYQFPKTPFTFIKDYFSYLITKGDFKIQKRYPADSHGRVACDWVVGACLFVPAKVFRETGGFDQRFFLYNEDIDLCKRIKDRGYEIVVLKESHIKHIKYGSSVSLSKLRYFKIRTKSIVLYCCKHHFPKRWAFARIFKDIPNHI